MAYKIIMSCFHDSNYFQDGVRLTCGFLVLVEYALNFFQYFSVQFVYNNLRARLSPTYIHTIHAYIHITYIHAYINNFIHAGNNVMKYMYIHTYLHSLIGKIYTDILVHARSVRKSDALTCKKTNIHTYIHIHTR
jgi:hypothetical protein